MHGNYGEEHISSICLWVLLSINAYMTIISCTGAQPIHRNDLPNIDNHAEITLNILATRNIEDKQQFKLNKLIALITTVNS